MSTGRYFYIDKKTGRKFCIEPISVRNQRTNEKEIEVGGIMQVNGGSVTESESIITKENGYINIEYLSAGTSPDGHIEQLLTHEK